MVSPEAKVYVVDDDDAMRDSLQWLLQSQGFKVQLYSSSEEFLASYRPENPGCLVLDVRMPGMSGLELYEKLNAQQTGIPVIFITGHGDVPMAVNALKKGAVDFIEKPFNDKDMLRLIEKCLELDRERRKQAAQHACLAERFASLTPREREVTNMVVAGKLNKVIADELKISIKTVEAHRAKIMEKLEVGSVAELVQLVIAAEPDNGKL